MGGSTTQSGTVCACGSSAAGNGCSDSASGSCGSTALGCGTTAEGIPAICDGTTLSGPILRCTKLCGNINSACFTCIANNSSTVTYTINEPDNYWELISKTADYHGGTFYNGCGQTGSGGKFSRYYRIPVNAYLGTPFKGFSGSNMPSDYTAALSTNPVVVNFGSGYYAETVPNTSPSIETGYVDGMNNDTTVLRGDFTWPSVSFSLYQSMNYYATYNVSVTFPSNFPWPTSGTVKLFIGYNRYIVGNSGSGYAGLIMDGRWYSDNATFNFTDSQKSFSAQLTITKDDLPLTFIINDEGHAAAVGHYYYDVWGGCEVVDYLGQKSVLLHSSNMLMWGSNAQQA